MKQDDFSILAITISIHLTINVRSVMNDVLDQAVLGFLIAAGIVEEDCHIIE